MQQPVIGTLVLKDLVAVLPAPSHATSSNGTFVVLDTRVAVRKSIASTT